jgi:hypothetical protein
MVVLATPGGVGLSRAALILAFVGAIVAGEAQAVSAVEPGKNGAAFDPPLPAISSVADLPDVSLGVALLSSLEMLSGGIGSTHALWHQLNEAGSDDAMTFTNVVRAPDGSATRHVFTRFEDLDLYVRKIMAARRAYTEEIDRRGYFKMAASYSVDAADDCSPDWFGDGSVMIHKAGAVFELWQGQKGFIGATVRETVVVIFHKGLHPPLVGRGGEEIHFVEAGGKCAITLAPSE